MSIDLDAQSADWFVKPGDVVLDVGAYLGKTAALYLDRGASEVHAFEPLPRNRDRIPDALRNRAGFNLHPYALSDRSGRQDLVVPRRNDGAGSLSRAYFEWAKRDKTDEGEAHSVEVRTLDELGLRRAQFWKIDAEGSELAILRGADRTLRQAPPDIVQLEIFRVDKAVYAATLALLKERFAHVWAIGISLAGKLVHYDLTAKTEFSKEFFESLYRAGTPHYYASHRSFWEWIGLPAR